MVTEEKMRFYARIIESNGSFRITIPKEIIEVKKWKSGDMLDVEANQIIEGIKEE